MKNIRILLVDDNPMVLEMEKIILKGKGFEVLTATNGVEAIELAKENIPDVILLDVMMPELDGLKVAKILSKNEKTKAIPIIMVTAKSQTDDMEKGYLNGAIAYITKPFKSDELLNVIKVVLEMETGVKI